MFNSLLYPSSLVVVVMAMAISWADSLIPADTSEDELILKEAKVATDGRGLLEFFRRRVPTEKAEARIGSLIRQLGSSDFQVREKATSELMASGPVALSELRRARKDPDAEIKRRAAQCVESIEREASPTVTSAAVRLLKARTPSGAEAILLAFLPHADDDAVEDEISIALLALGVNHGKVDSILTAALEDKLPARRAAAAMVLGRYGTPEQKEAVRNLLKDPEPRIRFRAAQGLVAARDKSAIPFLAALVGDGPIDIARQAEELLARIAGDSAPKVGLVEDQAVRRRCRSAWDSWWKANEEKLDLAKADVDLVVTNPALRARKLTQQFVDAFIKGDVASLKRISAVPFRLPGEQEFQTQEELAKFFEQMAQQRPPQKITLTVQNVVSIEEYAKIAPPQEKPSLDKIRNSQFRVVYIQVEMNGAGGSEGASVFVRIRGGQARVVGIGNGHPTRKDLQPPAVKRAEPAQAKPAPRIEKAPPPPKDKDKN